MLVPIAVTSANAFSPKLPASVAKLGHDELFLIELQGTLDVQCPESTAKDGQLIGTLNTADMNKPTLLIGHHLLEGKVVSLPKPLGVLHKRVRNTVATLSSVDASTGDDDPDGGDDASTGRRRGEQEVEEGTTCTDPEVRWDVTAVVRKKMVFSKRPMPIAKTKAKPASTSGASASRT